MTKLQRGAVIRTANAWDDFSTNTLTATAAAVALAAGHTPIMEVMLQNDPDSQEVVYVGNQFAQYWELAAGSNITIKVCDLSLVYVTSAGGTAVVNWIAGT